jgi:ligand-binding SRPBCC domain-containing protein
MLRGAFRSFVHDHHFEPCAQGTVMKDVLTFRSPFGIVGAIVDRLVMARYLTRLLTQRNAIVKAVLERDQG